MDRKIFREDGIYRGHRIVKRWWTEYGDTTEWHLVLLEEYRGRFQPILRHDNDQEGQHLHLKMLDVERASLGRAEALVRKVFDRMDRIRDIALGEAGK
ncbi:MAG: hypothetical protein HYY13_08075 [Nitrospirae bacterium]|nr:hypothetical protein [Nitrospirota bacterium]